MKFLFRTVQLGSPRQPDEGLRIGTVRHLPRGVFKKDYARHDYFDVWLPTLAPSRELLSKVKRANTSIQTALRLYRSEMGRTEPRQVIQLLAELAKQTPISVGCYCTDEARCHRSVLGQLIRTAAGLPPEPPLSEFCIYTIRHPEELESARDAGYSIAWEEKKRWAQGVRLLEQACRENTRLPLLFGDATNCSLLTHWAVIQDIHLLPTGTKYTFSPPKRIPGRHSPQELALQSTGELIAEDFIKPYAICKTPRFLHD